jgi:hypothetical protein
MKAILKIAICFLILFAACKKSTDEQYILKFYGDAYEDIGYSVSILSDGYVMAGEVTDITRQDVVGITSSNKNMGIIKTGWDGNVVWKVSAAGKSGKRWNDWGSKIYQNTDGSLICVGTSTTDSTAAGFTTDIFVVKVKADGTIEWQKSYGGKGNQTGIDIVNMMNGNYMILGSTDLPATTTTGNISGNTDIILLKMKENGDSVESFVYGYPGNDLGKVLNWNTDGSFLVYGTTDMSDPGQEKNNLLLLKINLAGFVTQAKIIGGTEDEYAGDMEVLSDGYLLTYSVLYNDGSQGIKVTKLNTNIYSTPVLLPKKLSIKNPASPSDTSASVYALSRYKTDSFLLAGQSGKGSSSKMLIFEMDATGNLVAGHQMIKGSTGAQAVYDVASGADDYIIAVGKNSYDVNSMITLLKFKF